MSIEYNPDDLATWTLEQLCENDSDDDEETFERKAIERGRRREVLVRKEAVAVARRKAENRRAKKRESHIKAAIRRAEEMQGKVQPDGNGPATGCPGACHGDWGVGGIKDKRSSGSDGKANCAESSRC